MMLGFVGLVELTSFLTIGAAQGKTLVLFGNKIDVHAALPWVISAVLLLGGGFWFRVEARAFHLTWERLMAEAAPARAVA
jgi:branched-chain amino acid transport system permease protein